MRYISDISSKIYTMRCKNNQYSLFSFFLVIGFVFINSNTRAQVKTLLALSKGDHVLAIIDPITLKTKTRIPVGDDPHEVIASSDGKSAFVSNSYGSNPHEIDMIDLVSQKRLKDINIQPLSAPHGLDFADGKLWFSAEGASAVGRYNNATHEVDWSMGTGQDRTHMIYVSADAKKIFTTNVNAGTVSILVDTLVKPRFGPPPTQKGQTAQSVPPPAFQPKIQHQWLQTVVHVGKGSEGFDVTPNGKELWTAAADDGTIWIVDLINKKTIKSPSIKAIGANRLKFTPDGKLALISSLRTGDLYIIDAESRQLIKQLKLGKGCAGILPDNDNKIVYVACSADNYIAVIDLQKMQVINKIELAGPDGLAWAILQ